jgi:hypothetical protein
MKFSRTLCALAAALLATLSVAQSQNPPTVSAAQLAANPESLHQRIESLDRALFDAFNRCDLVALATYFAPELEFYHDKAGVTWSRERFLSDVKNNVCGKFRRELVPGTLEVYPIGEWGAMYLGTHKFCQFTGTRCEGVGKFMHIWQHKAGQWQITRVVSYDHRAAKD